MARQLEVTRSQLLRPQVVKAKHKLGAEAGGTVHYHPVLRRIAIKLRANLMVQENEMGLDFNYSSQGMNRLTLIQSTKVCKSQPHYAQPSNHQNTPNFLSLSRPPLFLLALAMKVPGRQNLKSHLKVLPPRWCIHPSPPVSISAIV